MTDFGRLLDDKVAEFSSRFSHENRSLIWTHKEVMTFMVDELKDLKYDYVQMCILQDVIENERRG